MVFVSLSNVVLLAGDDVCTWLVRGEAVSPVVVFVPLGVLLSVTLSGVDAGVDV